MAAAMAVWLPAKVAPDRIRESQSRFHPFLVILGTRREYVGTSPLFTPAFAREPVFKLKHWASKIELAW
jgi:hypothetical protein